MLIRFWPSPSWEDGTKNGQYVPALLWLTHMKWVGKCIEVSVHSSYLSQPPQPAVVYFFSAGVLFRIMNAKFWPILSHCDQVRLYFRECKHFLVYFLQAHIMWWCIKIDKYGVWVWLHLIRMKKLTDVRYYLCSPLFIERRWHDAAFLNCRQLQSLSDSSIAPQALGLWNVKNLEPRL